MSDLLRDKDGNTHFNPDNGLANMPIKFIGEFWNACTDPCDMLSGPCACGAWHQQEEWPDDIQEIVFGFVSDKATVCKRTRGRK